MAFCRSRCFRPSCWCPPNPCRTVVDPVFETPIQCTEREINDGDHGLQGTARQYVFPNAEGPAIQVTETLTKAAKQNRDVASEVRLCIPGWMTCTQQANKAEPQVELEPGMMAEPMPNGGGFYLRQVTQFPSQRPCFGPPCNSPCFSKSVNEMGYRCPGGSCPSLGSPWGSCQKTTEPGFRVLVSPISKAQPGGIGGKPSNVYVVHRKYQPLNNGFPGGEMSPYFPSPPSPSVPDLLSPDWRPRRTSGYTVTKCCQCQGQGQGPVHPVVSDIEVWGEQESFNAKHELIHSVPLPPGGSYFSSLFPQRNQPSVSGRPFTMSGSPDISVTYADSNSSMK